MFGTRRHVDLETEFGQKGGSNQTNGIRPLGTRKKIKGGWVGGPRPQSGSGNGIGSEAG